MSETRCPSLWHALRSAAPSPPLPPPLPPSLFSSSSLPSSPPLPYPTHPPPPPPSHPPPLPPPQAYRSSNQAVAIETNPPTEHHTYSGAVLTIGICSRSGGHAAAKHPSPPIVADLGDRSRRQPAALTWAEARPSFSPPDSRCGNRRRPATPAPPPPPLSQPRLVVPGVLEGARYVRDLGDQRFANR